MQRLSRAIISGFLVAVMAFSMCVPALATDDYQSTATSWWNYLFHSLSKATDGLVFKDVLPVNKVVDLIGFAATDSVCNLSGDSFHHADSIANCETGSDKYGTYAITTCKYCGEKFKYYASDLEKQYNDAVSDLPARGFKSDGSLLLKVPYSCIRMSPRKNYSDPAQYVSFGTDWTPGTMSTSSIESYYGVPVDLTAGFGAVSCTFGDKENHTMYWRYYFSDFRAPISGYYQGVEVPYSFSYIGSDGSGSFPFTISKYQNSTYLGKNALLISQGVFTGFECTAIKFHSTSFSAYVFSVIPDTLDNGYSSTSRPGAIIGDLSITNNNVTTKVENTSIINETNNTFYNPVTNNTYNMDGWAYDYSSRTYNFTINNVDNSVTYGDEYITIREGDTIYNIYYYINQDSGSGGDGDGCQHSYTSAITTAATCTTPGVETFTCSKCGNQYTQAIPVLGHDWLASEVTPDSYTLPEGTSCPDCGGTDFTFTLDQDSGVYTLTCSACEKVWTVQGKVTYGQTKYVCSRCGESYVETNDPDSGLFASIGNFFANGITWVVDKLKQLIDSLSGINDIFTSFIDDIKAKSREYPAFLAAVIDVLPDDLMTVVWFSIIATIALIVWKLWFR